jgi:hypothetical protein
MIENNPDQEAAWNKADDLVASWNKATSQKANPMVNSRLCLEFMQAGYTSEQLVLVVDYLKAQNLKASAPQYRRKITLPRVIGDLVEFDALIQLAEAWNRNRSKLSKKQEFLNSLHRGEVPTGKPRHIGEVINAIAHQNKPN